MLKGKLIAIQYSEQKGLPKRTVESGNLIKDFGLEGDRHAGKGLRQVSLLALGSAKEMKEMNGTGICTARFAENFTTQGIDIWKLPVGSKLKIGETLLEITQIGKGCHQGCQIRKRGETCILIRQVVFARVLQGGKISVGDEITVES